MAADSVKYEVKEYNIPFETYYIAIWCSVYL